jgi:hypothetical protein
MSAIDKNRDISTWMLSACGVWLVGLGFYFCLLRPPLLPEDLRFMGTTAAQIRAALPGFEHWLQRVFIVMGASMGSAGVLTLFVATIAMPLRRDGVRPPLVLRQLRARLWPVHFCFLFTSNRPWS